MQVDRRAALTGLGACPACAAAARAAEAPHWSWTGADGPEHWGTLDPSYKTCGAGTQQSPVDLRDAIRAFMPRLRIGWRPEAYTVVNSGRTIQANAERGSTLAIGRQRYELKQFHFHAPSEHALKGRRFAMEAHFVHAQESTGRLAVIGVFMRAGGRNDAFTAIMEAAPKAAGAGQALEAPVDPRQFLPQNSAVFRYRGSLTMPPCSEIVEWSVYDRPIAVAAADIAAFEALYPMSARPLQPINRRYILIGR